jgi:hypothetical protein
VGARIYEDAREVPSSRRKYVKDLMLELKVFGGSPRRRQSTYPLPEYREPPVVRSRERFYGGSRWGGNTFAKSLPWNRLDAEAFLKKPDEGTETGRLESGFGPKKDLMPDQRERLLSGSHTFNVDFAAAELRAAAGFEQIMFEQQCAALGVNPERVREIHRTTPYDIWNALSAAYDEIHGTTSQWVQNSLIIDGLSHGQEKLLRFFTQYHIPAGPRAEASRAHRKKLKKARRKRGR